MFCKFEILCSLTLVAKLVSCSEFEVFNDELYPQTLHSFWDNSSFKSAEPDGSIFISAPIRIIDHKLGLLGKLNRNPVRERLLPRLVPKQVSGYPGNPVVCYYCNVFWGTSGHYPNQDAAATPSCSGENSFCGEGKPCCSGLTCQEVEVKPNTFQDLCHAGTISCEDDGDCDNEKTCIDEKCKECLKDGAECPGKYPCCVGSCMGGTCERMSCVRRRGNCESKSCCAGFHCVFLQGGGQICLCGEPGKPCGRHACCKGNVCLGSKPSAGQDGICEARDCTSANAAKVCGKEKLCKNGKCRNQCNRRGQHCRRKGDNQPCCNDGVCASGLCKDPCINNGQPCNLAGDPRPCCGGVKCVRSPIGKYVCETKCKKNADCPKCGGELKPQKYCPKYAVPRYGIIVGICDCRDPGDCQENSECSSTQCCRVSPGTDKGNCGLRSGECTGSSAGLNCVGKGSSIEDGAACSVSISG